MRNGTRGATMNNSAAILFTRASNSNRVGAQRPDIWSVRIGLSFRALGVLDTDEIVWFWIGTLAENAEAQITVGAWYSPNTLRMAPQISPSVP